MSEDLSTQSRQDAKPPAVKPGIVAMRRYFDELVRRASAGELAELKWQSECQVEPGELNGVECPIAQPILRLTINYRIKPEFFYTPIFPGRIVLGPPSFISRCPECGSVIDCDPATHFCGSFCCNPQSAILNPQSSVQPPVPSGISNRESQILECGDEGAPDGAALDTDRESGDDREGKAASRSTLPPHSKDPRRQFPDDERVTEKLPRGSRPV